jgi:predicted 3-demethylubiquinone-9 3-methyltransferase (glyoxalase superfamily)
MAKNTICLWYDKNAEAAARFYAETFPDSVVGAVHRAPSDYPSGKAGDVLIVEFTIAGVPCIGLNGGPAFKHNEAFSFQIATDDQDETDRYWNAIVGNGGQESECGWCKDKWGVSWQITPRVLTEALAALLRHVAAGVSIPRPAPNPPQQPFPFRLLCQLAPIDEAGGDLGKHLFSLDDRLVDRMATLTPAARNGITGVMPLRMRKLRLAWLVTETLRRSMSYISASV